MLRKLVRHKTILRLKRREPFVTELERREYDKLVKESRKVNTKFYSDQQAHIENKFIAEFEEKERCKKIADDLRLRTELIRRAWADRNDIEKKREEERARKRRLQKVIFEQLVRRQKCSRVIKALDAESRSWISCGGSKVTAPDIFGAQSNYFSKLQERAMLASEGNFDQMDDYNVENEVLDYKNLLLIPLFGNIKNLTKQLIESPLSKLQIQWQKTNSLLGQNASPEQRREIRDTYQKLFDLLKAKHASPEQRFELLENKLRLMCSLLQTWKKYTTVLLLSHEEARAAMKLESMVREKEEDDVKTHEGYKKKLDEFFNKSGESLTDTEKFFSSAQNIEDFLQEEKGANPSKEEFHRVLSKYISKEDIHAFEDEFDQLRVKYDSVYGELKLSDLHRDEPIFSESQLRMVFGSEEDPASLDIEQESITPSTIAQTESSFFGHLLRERVALFEGLVPTSRLDKAKKIAAKIAETRVDEAALLRKIIEAEVNANLLSAEELKS